VSIPVLECARIEVFGLNLYLPWETVH
jgi:hypothetical protein